jgi:hypothetical protein
LRPWKIAHTRVGVKPAVVAFGSVQAASFAAMSIWAFHGAQDGTVPVSGTRYPMAATQSAGATVLRYTRTYDGSTSSIRQDSLARAVQAGQRHIFTEYTDGSHFVWDNSFLNPLLPTWLFAQVKGQTVSTATLSRRPGRQTSPAWSVVVHTVDACGPGMSSLEVYTLDGSRVTATRGGGYEVWRVPEGLAPATRVVRQAGR